MRQLQRKAARDRDGIVTTISHLRTARTGDATGAIAMPATRAGLASAVPTLRFIRDPTARGPARLPQARLGSEVRTRSGAKLSKADNRWTLLESGIECWEIPSTTDRIGQEFWPLGQSTACIGMRLSLASDTLQVARRPGILQHNWQFLRAQTEVYFSLSIAHCISDNTKIASTSFSPPERLRSRKHSGLIARNEENNCFIVTATLA